ncbi:hypothetical protein C900_01933 [Fulvivirga imtechensis AK7]|uniref:SSD domain-containing protein n=1 Tax=Fulvivirga imtechensis AK7 TaxID=1237149 RepID=L8JV23_9BACT|nr:MMPL family transporter [Fulvivirga imtechensis]ELR72068.1 hypothetical protein C900_01933 [Fulvivirga imtechensis AK7]
MKKLSDVLSRYFASVPDFVRERRVMVWLLLVGITVFAILGFPRVKFDLSTDGWFKDDDPVKVALDDFKAEFGSDDGIYIVYKPKDGNLFSPQSLEAVKSLCDDIISARAEIKEEEKSPLGHVVRVTSLATANFLEAKDDLLISRSLVGASVPTSQEELDAMRKTAQAQKKFELAYYSKDMAYGGILIQTDFGAIPEDFEEPGDDDSEPADDVLVMNEMTMETDMDATGEKVRFKPTETQDYHALMTEINTYLNNPKYADHLEFHPVGNAVQSIYDGEIMAQLGLLYLSMVAIMIVLLWIIFRSLSGVVWPVVVIIIATIWIMGFTGWLGVTTSFYVMLTVMMLLAMGMADTIHVMSEYMYYRNQNEDHRTALRNTYRKVAFACLLTTFTTMIGFLALSVSPIVHIKVFGFMTAAGVFLELLFTVYILPLMLDIWSPVKKKKASGAKASFIPNFSNFLQNRLDGIIPIVERRPMTITGIFIVILALCFIGASKVKVSFDMMENYDKESVLRHSYEHVDKHMMGTQNMEIFLDLGEEYAFQDPFVLTTIDKLQDLIERKYSNYTLRTESLADVVKDANQKLNESREEMYVIPESQSVVSQTLFMFNNANPSDRRKLVSDNYSKSHITVNLRNTDAASYQGMFDLMQRDIDEMVAGLKEKYPDTKVTLTGTLAMMMKASVYISESTGGSLAFAIVAITITLLIVFGSFKAGAIAIIPNLIPSILTYSLLGWLGIPLDMNTLLIGPIIIGVAVDDTIHFITHYRSEVVIDGNVKRALKAAVSEAGQAVTFTTLVLGIGFGILSLATGPISNAGKLGALAIFTGLLCDLFLLPAMILLFKPTFQSKEVVQTEDILNENMLNENLLLKEEEVVK